MQKWGNQKGVLTPKVRRCSYLLSFPAKMPRKRHFLLKQLHSCRVSTSFPSSFYQYSIQELTNVVKPEIWNRSFQLAFAPTLGTHRPGLPGVFVCSEQMTWSCLEEVLEDFLLKFLIKAWVSHQGDRPVIAVDGFWLVQRVLGYRVPSQGQQPGSGLPPICNDKGSVSDQLEMHWAACKIMSLSIILRSE